VVDATLSTVRRPGSPRRAIEPSPASRRASQHRARRRTAMRTFFITIAVLTGVVVAATGLGFVMDAVYSGKALPGFVVAGHDIGGLAPPQITAVLGQAESAITVDLTVGDETQKATGADLGITVNKEHILTTVAEQARRALWIYNLNKRTEIPLDVTIDAAQFNIWLAGHFPHQFRTPVDAGLKYNPKTHQFDVVPSVPGAGATAADLSTLATKLSYTGQTAYTMTLGPIPAPVGDDLAGKTADKANATLGVTCALTFEDETVYTLSPDDIAALTTVTTTADGLGLTYKPATATAFVDKTLAPSLNREPVTLKQTVDETGVVLEVAQEGKPGRTLLNTTGVGADIAACLAGGADKAIPVIFQDIPYTTDETIKPSHPDPPASSASTHWADVNLTTQTVTLMDGTTPGASFTVSSGAPETPTPIGTFHVYAKVPLQSMSGCNPDCYYYPDVHWSTWFYGNYGFHEAYWRSDFGAAVSHGCINMRLEDAEAVYNWLRIGDAVTVHT